MKKLLAIFFMLSVFVANAQQEFMIRWNLREEYAGKINGIINRDSSKVRKSKILTKEYKEWGPSSEPNTFTYNKAGLATQRIRVYLDQYVYTDKYEYNTNNLITNIKVFYKDTVEAEYHYYYNAKGKITKIVAPTDSMVMTYLYFYKNDTILEKQIGLGGKDTLFTVIHNTAITGNAVVTESFYKNILLRRVIKIDGREVYYSWNYWFELNDWGFVNNRDLYITCTTSYNHARHQKILTWIKDDGNIDSWSVYLNDFGDPLIEYKTGYMEKAEPKVSSSITIYKYDINGNILEERVYNHEQVEYETIYHYTYWK